MVMQANCQCLYASRLGINGGVYGCSPTGTDRQGFAVLRRSISVNGCSGHDKGPTCAAQLVGQGAPFEPFIENRLSTIEVVQQMDRTQRLRRIERQGHAPPFLHGAFNAMRRSSPGFAAGGNGLDQPNP